MTDVNAEMRAARVERLLNELVYEITRGLMERELEPDLHMTKIVPCNDRGDGTASIELHVFANSGVYGANNLQTQTKPRLRIVK